MFKKRFARLTQIVTGQRGSDDEDVFTLGTGLSWLEKFVHFWMLVVQSFVRNRCPIRASALSYSTLLALIPMMAVALSVTSSLLKSEGEDEIFRFIDQIVANVMPQVTVKTNVFSETASAPATQTVGSEPAPGGSDSTTDAASVTLTDGVTATNGIVAAVSTNAPLATDTQVIAAQRDAARYIHNFIQTTQSGTIGVSGMIVLVFVGIFMLSRIEETFNDIWGVTCGRNWFVRVVQYWAVLTLGPLLLAAALALMGGPHLQSTREVMDKTALGQFLFQLLPLVVLWLAFASFYKLVPNTKVNFSAALAGGALAGTLWLVNNMVGFLYVSRVVTYSKIYGSLGLVPVFMAGLYLSWLILLLGAQVAYAFQNRASYLQDRLAENVNQRGREFVALRLMTCIGQRFQRGLPPPNITQISTELGIPSRLVQQVLQVLIAARLVVEVARGESAYAPARPLETINAHQILAAMRSSTGQELVTRDEPVRAEVLGEFARIQEAEKAAAKSVTMLALVSRAQAALQLSIPVEESDRAMVTTLAPPAKTVEAASKPAIVVTPIIEATPTPPPKPPKTKPIQHDQVEVETHQSGGRQDAAPDTPTANSAGGSNESFPL
jgi:membrane protein